MKSASHPSLLFLFQIHKTINKNVSLRAIAKQSVTDEIIAEQTDCHIPMKESGFAMTKKNELINIFTNWFIVLFFRINKSSMKNEDTVWELKKQA